MEQPYLHFWHWWALALLLGGLEMFLPGAAFLWVGGAAALTGLVMFVAPGLGESVQLMLFGALAVVAFLTSRRFARPDALDEGNNTLNRRGEQYIGQWLMLETPLSNGHGRARLGDSSWPVLGDGELPAGTRVKVVGIDGVNLRVVAE
ncbi:NfeD family protein [Niveispirillum sp. SYP-B3756]|uniref:NfeD family protein n=1 Tax=Niveispirillum sp. SYP-B3756 TaxID=2662178 RepID=UPI001292A6BA|nr:NfeD family protein [Niveispirillum sp. SYP-B3756]MQP64131.1 NfeD family protein [Niveispirillum sp. SYP-B3756]